MKSTRPLPAALTPYCLRGDRGANAVGLVAEGAPAPALALATHIVAREAALAFRLSAAITISELDGAPLGLSYPAGEDRSDQLLFGARDGGGFGEFLGRQRLEATASEAKRIVVVATTLELGGVAAVVRTDDPRLSLQPDAANRAFRRGTIQFRGRLEPHEFETLQPSVFSAFLRRLRLVHDFLHLAVDHGILRGFLKNASAYLKSRSRPWYGAGIEHAGDDPHVLRVFGRQVSSLHALDELYAEAERAVQFALSGAQDDDHAALEAVAIARAYAAKLGTSFISEGIELLGASATSAQHEFDAFWREFSLHGSSDPPRRSFVDIGASLVQGGSEHRDLLTSSEARKFA